MPRPGGFNLLHIPQNRRLRSWIITGKCLRFLLIEEWGFDKTDCEIERFMDALMKNTSFGRQCAYATTKQPVKKKKRM
jgi:hypothetical protein